MYMVYIFLIAVQHVFLYQFIRMHTDKPTRKFEIVYIIFPGRIKSEMLIDICSVLLFYKL